jgi:hypothetical protein
MKDESLYWPDVTLGLIRGVAAISLEGDKNKDSERLRILISMTIWAIWKSKIKKSINNQDVAPNEMTQTLKETLSDVTRNSWNATRTMEGSSKVIRQRELRKLWADKRMTEFDLVSGPHINFT